MTFDKPTEWGSRFSFPENVKFDFDMPVNSIIQEITVKMAEQYDDAIVEAIAREAWAAGVSDLTVLNKAAILEAIEKQIPQRPDLEGDGYSGGELVIDTGCCPRCCHSYELEYHTPRYCENCGQALEWGEE